MCYIYVCKYFFKINNFTVSKWHQTLHDKSVQCLQP